MARTFRLLDLYCGAGGASMGYHQAGFEVVGVDFFPMPNYPFELVEGVHAIDYIKKHAHEFDVIHASPPCQAYSWAAKRWHDVPRRDLIAPTRKALIATGLPYVIENVVGAPLNNPITLCGLSFRDTATFENPCVLKHRRFESNVPLVAPAHVKHVPNGVKEGIYITVAGHGGDNARGNHSAARWQAAMGIDWTTDRHELAEAIPPDYTKFIGKQLLAWLRAHAK